MDRFPRRQELFQPVQEEEVECTGAADVHALSEYFVAVDEPSDVLSAVEGGHLVAGVLDDWGGVGWDGMGWGMSGDEGGRIGRWWGVGWGSMLVGGR